MSWSCHIYLGWRKQDHHFEVKESTICDVNGADFSTAKWWFYIKIALIFNVHNNWGKPVNVACLKAYFVSGVCYWWLATVLVPHSYLFISAKIHGVVVLREAYPITPPMFILKLIWQNKVHVASTDHDIMVSFFHKSFNCAIRFSDVQDHWQFLDQNWTT